jgi:hypothetical protein
MTSASQISEHMEVVGSDGGHVGKVDHVKGSEIELAKFDTSTLGAHKMIPLSWVDYVDEKVHLTLSKDQARDRWTDKPH